ncbi:MAG: DUF2103 domain-containing protein [Patescibacteria group bacterium]
MASKSKGHYDGAKKRGNHTTVMCGAEKVIKILDRCSLIEGISLGVITTNGGGNNGAIRVKSRIDGGAIVVKISKSGSSQEVRVYGSNLKRIEGVIKKEFPN